MSLPAAPHRLRAAAGLALLIAFAWSLSTDRRGVSWRVVGWGLALQLLFGLVVLRTPAGVSFFHWMNGVVMAVLGYAELVRLLTAWGRGAV